MRRAPAFSEILRALVTRPLVREPSRTLLTTTGIMVGVAVLVAIQLANQSALRSFSESIDAISGRANYQIVAGGAPIDERTLLRLQPFWSQGLRFAPVIDVDGSIAAEGTPVRVLGVDLFSDLQFRDYRYARIATDPDGATDSVGPYLALFHHDSVILPRPFAREHRLDLGSRIALNVNGRTARLVVRGILDTEGPATAFNGSLAILDIATAQTAFALEGRLTRIDLLVPEDASASIVSAIEKVLPAGARIERPSRRSARVDKMLRAFRVNLYALAAVALLVGVFLVYNTVLISILRRRRQIGIFRTLGVTAREIFSVFLIEGTIFGLAGSAGGIALGWLLAWSALGLIGRTVNSLYITSAPTSIVLTAQVVAGALAIGTGIAVLSALQPAWEASRTPPIDVVRHGATERLGPKRAARLALAGGVAFVLAWLATRIPPVASVSIGGYLSVILCIGGFSLLTPIALRATAAILRRPVRAWFDIAGDLATASLPVSLRRTAIAVAALAIAIGMTVAVSLMIGSFRATVETWVAQTVRSDLWIRPARNLSNSAAAAFPPSITKDLEAIDVIAAIDRFRGRDVVFRDSLILVGSGDFDTMLERGDLPMIRPRSAGEAVRNAVRNDGVLVSESFASKFNVDVGDTIDLPTAEGITAFPVEGIYRDYSTDRGVVVMNRPLYVARFHDDAINTVAVFLRKGVDPEAARAEIERRLGAKYSAFAFTNRTIRAEVMKIFDQTFLITWALLLVSIVVAVLGIVNTLSAIILERRRELALLRVTGMLRREVRTVVVLESVILGIASTVLGAICGTVLSVILIFVINRQSFGWTIEFHPPHAILAMSVAATFVATILAGLFSAKLADRLDLAAELAEE